MNTVFSTKFIFLLQTWEAAELKSFELWLQSPWCNSNKNLIRLFARLKPYYPDFEDQKLTKERLFRQVLPNGKFSERRMNNLMSEAYLAAEKFLIFQRFSKEHSLQKRLQTKEFQRRSLDNWFFKGAYQEIDRLEEKEIKDWEDHLELFRLHRRIYQHPDQDTALQKGREAIVNMGQQIDLLYLLEKAAVINEMIFRNRLFKAENHDVPAELQKWRTLSDGIQHPALELYRMRFAYTAAEMLPQYLALRAAFLEQFDALNAREQKVHLLSLLNDTKLLIKSGSLDITESLPLYQRGLETGAILNEGMLTDNTYLTIVTASNTKGTFDFTNYFIENYTNCLSPKNREDCVHWAHAHTAYWRNDLEGCLDILQGYDFRAPNFQLIGRVLNTQVYFDLYLKDGSCQTYLFQFFDTFEKWLNREKVWSKSSAIAFLRFVQKCRTLAKYYAEIDPEPQKLETLLEKEHNIQALNWLIQKKEEVLRLKAKQQPRF